jgi:hypothetical protein
MVQEYSKKFYFPSLEKRLNLMENDWEVGKQFSAWKRKVFYNWDKLNS